MLAPQSSSSNLRRQISLSSLAQSHSLLPPPSLAVPDGAGTSHAAPYPGGGTNTVPSSEGTKSLSRCSRSRLNAPAAEYFSDVEEYGSSGSSSESEDYGELSLIRSMQNLNIQGSIKPLENRESREPVDAQWRFHGKSSAFKLINTARRMQQIHLDEVAKAAGEDGEGSPPRVLPEPPTRREFFWTSPAVCPIYPSFLVSDR